MRARRVLLLAAIAGLATLVLWRARNSKGDRLAREVATEDVESVRSSTREPAGFELRELSAQIDVLVQLRRDGQHSAASMQREQIEGCLRDGLNRDPPSLAVRAAVVLDRNVQAFESYDKDRRGEHYVLDDLSRLSAVEMSTAAAQHRRGCECVKRLIAWGPPADHVKGGEPNHGPCYAFLHVVGAALGDTGTQVDLGLRVVESQWVARCPVLGAFVATLARGPLAERAVSTLASMLRTSTDPRMIFELSRALAESGRIDVILDVLLAPGVRLPTPIITGCIEGLSLEEAEHLLWELAGKSGGRGLAQRRVLHGVRSGYRVFGRRWILERPGGLHGLVEAVLDAGEKGPPSEAAGARTLLMTAVTGGCAEIFLAGKPIPGSSDAEVRARVERRLADQALASYVQKTEHTAELWALGLCASDVERFLDTAERVLHTRGRDAALVDAANGLTSLAQRGKLDPEARSRVLDLARALIRRARAYGQKEALLHFAETAGFHELAPVFEEWSKRAGEREQSEWKRLSARVQSLNEQTRKAG